MKNSEGLNRLKQSVVSELGLTVNGQNYREYLNSSKFEVARELGINLQNGYNGNLTTSEAGRIGGKIGGKIGGNMVKKMIEMAESQL